MKCSKQFVQIVNGACIDMARNVLLWLRLSWVSSLHWHCKRDMMIMQQHLLEKSHSLRRFKSFSFPPLPRALSMVRQVHPRRMEILLMAFSDDNLVVNKNKDIPQEKARNGQMVTPITTQTPSEVGAGLPVAVEKQRADRLLDHEECQEDPAASRYRDWFQQLAQCQAAIPSPGSPDFQFSLPASSPDHQRYESFEKPLTGPVSFASNDEEPVSLANQHFGTALYDFFAGGDDEINLTAGEEFEIEYEVDDWFYVSTPRTFKQNEKRSCQNYTRRFTKDYAMTCHLVALRLWVSIF